MYYVSTRQKKGHRWLVMRMKFFSITLDCWVRTIYVQFMKISEKSHISFWLKRLSTSIIDKLAHVQCHDTSTYVSTYVSKKCTLKYLINEASLVKKAPTLPYSFNKAKSASKSQRSIIKAAHLLGTWVRVSSLWHEIRICIWNDVTSIMKCCGLKYKQLTSFQRPWNSTNKNCFPWI